jgi:hypothetical protein
MLSCINAALTPYTDLLQLSNSAASADDFLPHLIYIVLKSTINNFHTNVRFISEMTSSSEMAGEHFW